MLQSGGRLHHNAFKVQWLKKWKLRRKDLTALIDKRLKELEAEVSPSTSAASPAGVAAEANASKSGRQQQCAAA